MATASTVKAKVRYNLELSEEEAVTLRRVLYSGVAGSPHKSPRQYADAIGQALDDVDSSLLSRAERLETVSGVDGAIWFKDQTL